MKILLLAIALLAISACAIRIHDGNTILYDEGGRVDIYEADARTPHRIAGTCFSAATLYLKTGCVEPGATLVFHPPQAPGLQPPEWHSYWAQRIACSYPPELAAWYLADFSRTRTLTGQQVINMGARQCM